MNSCGVRPGSVSTPVLLTPSCALMRVGLGDRNAEVRVERVGVGQIAREVVLAGVEFGVVDVVAEADAVGRSGTARSTLNS